MRDVVRRAIGSATLAAALTLAQSAAAEESKAPAKAQQTGKPDKSAGQAPANGAAGGPKLTGAAPQPAAGSGAATDPAASGSAAELPKLTLPVEVADKVGHQIWLNETGGNADEIVAWNVGEDFMSLGIGHFIWFPAGMPAPFDESFPHLVDFYRAQNVKLPDWLDKKPTPPCPWRSRAELVKAKSTARVVQLKKFLLDTKGVQTQFLLQRAQRALDIMLAATPEEPQRRQIEAQFGRLTKASKDLYPIVDYINFKGEGTNPDETTFDPQTGGNEGWGLRHVLLTMKGTSSDPGTVLGEFADGAAFVLLRRIRNHPDSKRWREGWLKRVATYRKPLVPITAANPAAAKQR